MNIIRFFLLLLVLTPISVFAAEDEVVVSKVDFKVLQKNAIPSSSGQWSRIAVEILGKENKDLKANNLQWIRNVEVDLTLVYLDEKAKASERNDPKNMIVLKSKAKLFALKVNTKTPVVFYVPGEAYDIYRLSKTPYAYSIDLTVNGQKIELSKDNVKDLLSKNIIKSSDPKAAYESYLKLVNAASGVNENVLMSLGDAPFNVKRYEYSNSKEIPTYLPSK